MEQYELKIFKAYLSQSNDWRNGELVKGSIKALHQIYSILLTIKDFVVYFEGLSFTVKLDEVLNVLIDLFEKLINLS